jgi:hypothetical protein
MAFVRMGQDGSQVYIFDHVGGYKTCCHCPFTKPRPAPAPGYPDHVTWDDFKTTELDAMLAHVAEHRAAGHVVPDWVDQVLRDEWKDSDLWAHEDWHHRADIQETRPGSGIYE